MGYAYYRNESIIRSKTKEFFGVGTVVTAPTYLVLVVDFMLIGWIFGADAVAAAGLCDTFVDVAEFPGFVISAGGPVAAGILLGKRQFRQADGVFTLSFLLTLIGSLLCWCSLPFCGLIGKTLSNNGAIAGDVASYTFLIMAASPFVGIDLVLSSFAILDNHSKLAMDGAMVVFMTGVLFMAKTFGVTIDYSHIIILVVSGLLLSMATPGVPGAALVACIVLLNQMGVPMDCLPLVMIYLTITDMVCTVSNTTGDVAVSVIVASTEKMLDKDKYYQQD